jgi:hypothetical protein
MKIEIDDAILIIDCGFLKPCFELEISKIQNWEFVAEDNGATYFAFKYVDSTQYVSISSCTAEELKTNIDKLTEILNSEPTLNISKNRLSASGILIAADATLSVGILTGLLLTMVGS